jgi:hypothetical protein
VSLAFSEVSSRTSELSSATDQEYIQSYLVERSRQCEGASRLDLYSMFYDLGIVHVSAQKHKLRAEHPTLKKERKSAVICGAMAILFEPALSPGFFGNITNSLLLAI